MLFQLRDDAVDACLRLAVLCAHDVQLVLLLLEGAEQPLLLLLAEALDLNDKARKRFADLAEILVPHGGERIFRERGNALLRRRAVVQNQIGVVDVNLPGKFLDRLLLRVREHALVDLDGLRRLLFRFALCRCGSAVKRQLRDGGLCRRVECQFGHHIVSHACFPPLCYFFPLLRVF